MKLGQAVRVVWYDTNGAEIYKTTCCTYSDALKAARKDLKELAVNYTIAGVHLFTIDTK